MGVMRFLVQPTSVFDDWPEAYQAYVVGADGRVHPTRIERRDDHILCRRTISDSGKLHVAWPVPGFGRPILPTGSLSEREEAYLLPVELARGKLVQLRNQVAQWETSGLKLPPHFLEQMSSAHKFLTRAVLTQSEPEAAALAAQQSLIACCSAAELITTAYARQSVGYRNQRYPHLRALLGCRLEGISPDMIAADRFLSAFNAVQVPVNWARIEPREGEYDWDLLDRQVAWCENHRVFMVGGPLLDIVPGGIPEWLRQWQGDILNFQSFACDFVETAMSRYAGRIRLWEVVARANSGGALSLTEEQRLTLTARALEAARHVDQEGQIWLRIDQPWGEYLARGQHRVSPLQFVDALLRSNAAPSGINLEIAIGYTPRHNPSRDPLEFSRLIDQWSMFGVPLYITLAFPADVEPDPLANPQVEVDGDVWKAPYSNEIQAQWIAEYLPLLIAKPTVVGVFWSHFSDQAHHEYPHAGLIDGKGEERPSLQTWIDLRQARQ